MQLRALVSATLLCFVLILSACSSGGSGGGSDGSSSSLCSSLSTKQSSTSEKNYCSNSTSYSGGVAVTATARFEYRAVVLPNTGSSIAGLGDVTGPAAIRYAEVEVQNSSGSIVQCGTTDSSGGVSVTVPSGSGTYTLIVRSRGDNSHVKASVLNNTVSNTPYFVQKSFSVSSGQSAVSVDLPVAPATSTLEGGAFNILNQILLANEYLAANTTCPSEVTTSAQCAPAFTVAPKISVFWTPGLSPGAYFNSCNDGISFFLPGSSSDNLVRGLYIQGGIGGDVNTSDTDHFDNSVILHEYGHFMEDVYAKSDSPGGSHDANSIIDARLAWSEGWANYYQAAVSNVPSYADTTGNSSGETAFRVLFRTDSPNPVVSGQKLFPGYGQYDIPQATGEGAFREVAITRTLWSTQKTNFSGVGPNLGFPFIWQAFASTSLGLKSASVHHRSGQRFNRKVYDLLSTYKSSSLSSFTSALASEYQVTSGLSYPQRIERDYGALVAAGSCSDLTLVGTTLETNGANEAAQSDQLRNNDFFLYYNPGGASAGLTLQYTEGSGSQSTPDLDLYIYTDGYVFGDSTGLVGSSNTDSGHGEEVVSLVGVGSGYYLVNINMRGASIPSGSSAKANYHLRNPAGDVLCPQ